MKTVYCSKCSSIIGEFPDNYYHKRVCSDCKKKLKYEIQLEWTRQNKKHVKEYRQKHKDKWNANRRKKYHENIDIMRKKVHIWQERNRGKINEKRNNLRKQQRLNCLVHYGGNPPKCVCCNESNVKFLTIDHINNDGAEHRKKVKINQIYEWLIKNNFPEGFQVLCYNCNLGKAHNNGVCPHKNRNIY